MKKLVVLIAVCVIGLGTIQAQRAYKPSGGKKQSSNSSSSVSNASSSSTSSTNNYRSGSTVSIPKKEYLVRVAGSSSYWDIPGSPNSNSRSAAVQVWSLDNGRDRKVMFIPAGGGFYYIKFQHNGYYLDVKGGNLRKDVHLQIYQPNRSDAQKFKVLHLGNGEFKFVTTNGFALDCEGGGWKNGTKIQLWDDKGSRGQTFEIIEASSRKKYYGY